MVFNLSDSIRRILILDISGMYSSIVDEWYFDEKIDEEKEESKLMKYNDDTKYIVVKTM